MELQRLNLINDETDKPDESEVRFQIALLAAVGGLVASFLARFMFDVPLIPELMAQAFFAILPINLIAFVVGFLGAFAKHLAFLGFVIIYLLGLIGAAHGFLAQLSKRQLIWRKQIYALIFFHFVIWLFVMVALLPLLDAGIFGRGLRQGSLYTSLSLFLIFALYATALGWVMKFYIDKPEIAKSNNRRLSRRQVVRGMSYALLAIGIFDIGKSLIGTWFQFSAGRVKNGNGIFPSLDGLALEITSTEDFYVVSKNPFDPDVAAHNWQLEISGLVDKPRALTYEELKNFPAIEQYATLECIDNPVGGNLIGNALWRGVRLKDLLTHAGLQNGIVDIVFRASDGYTDSISLERAQNEATLLVYEMNGQPLTREHGFPLRLIVPGIFGMKNVKWITHIEAVDFDFKGYWQKRGWDDKAEYKTISRIDTPDGDIEGQTIISGVAFAGDRGIANVEVSTDDGKSWQAAEIKTPLSPYSWALWHTEWLPEQPGDYSIRVRATDGRGNLQESKPTPADPGGATGIHSIKVRKK
ncbi:MAG: molybdopterin-dependent oxidoreductase [Acidobacteriota bacterium]